MVGDTDGVFPMMLSAVLNGARENTPYIASKGEKDRERYSRLSADAKHRMVIRSMQIRARRYRTKQENDLDNQGLDDGDADMYEDAEARAFNKRDFQYKCYRQPGFQKAVLDPFDFIYKKLPRGHLVLKKLVDEVVCKALGDITNTFNGESANDRKKVRYRGNIVVDGPTRNLDGGVQVFGYGFLMKSFHDSSAPYRQIGLLRCTCGFGNPT
ncbi:hypothetical protein U9M48_027238 [Paspalum notatum var. saurae]|uniref:Uncharacterized protein n=1 Tax=Paspalum notatum var. saurae TaxID=547442 RepID=A0AAQ3TYG2_PASNO